jgi:formyltetrahydrofolate dehydrogenase
MVGGRMIPAAKFGAKDMDRESLQLNDDEKDMVIALKLIWEGILSIKVENSTEFFATGAGSMDVVR